MAFDARVFRILIASPSDVEDEREIVASVIQSWNDLNSYTRSVVLLALRWETHTSPTYGMRPQEVINRAIVDDCDLLVGIFWTRIGSPTGEADSGTLDEIERTGKAGKPIMLYFSRVEIDPEIIDFVQVEKLREFKNNTFPKGLVESYRSRNDFRDKFSRQLEMKLRELQDNNRFDINPINLVFLAIDNGKSLGNETKIEYSARKIDNYDGVPEDLMKKIKNIAQDEMTIKATTPIVLGVENISSAGLRNLYIQLEFSADIKEVVLSDRAPTSAMRGFSAHVWSQLITRSATGGEFDSLDKALRQYESDKLQKVGDKWILTIEMDAIQPQRLRVIKPYIFVSSYESYKLSITAKIYTESSPHPLELRASVDASVEIDKIKLDDLVPNWRDIGKEESNKLTSIKYYE